LLSRERPLGVFEPLFGFSEIPGIFDGAAVRQRCEFLQAHVQARSNTGVCFGLFEFSFRGKNGKPLASSIPLYGNGLDSTRYIPVQLYLDQADLGEFELVIQERSAQAAAELGEGRRKTRELPGGRVKKARAKRID